MLEALVPLDDRHVTHLTHVLGVDGAVSTSIADRIAYMHDASPISLKDAAHGRVSALPGAIVWPRSTSDVRALMEYAQGQGIPVVPYGSGSGIVGGALPPAGSIVVDMKRMNHVRDLDTVSMTVDVESGMNGQMFEDWLNQRGWTAGHYPQSIRASTIGGWIAHRAAGVASTRYGKIEDIVESLEVVLPDGRVLHTRTVPRSSTGPDLNQLFLGAEGAFGIVTSARLAIHPRPEVRTWQSYAYADLTTAIDVMRRVIQAGIRPSIVRLYDSIEAVPLLEGSDVPDGSVLLLWGVDGTADQVARDMADVRNRCDDRSIADLGEAPGLRWWSHRLSTAGLLTTLHDSTGIADALEVTGSWAALPVIYEDMRREMLSVAGDKARVFGHVSHIYHTGANLYMIFHAYANDPASVPVLYDRILDAAFTACFRHGGSLSHHHGVGRTKAAWLQEEHGDAGLDLIRSIQRGFDSGGVMNPGVGLHGGNSDA